MEFTLHRQLKAHYGGSGPTEVRWRNFRIDAVRDAVMIEIQLGSLASIRKKIERIAACHPLLVVHPLIVGKRLVKLDRRDGEVVEVRASPKRETPLDIVHQMVFMMRTFPHPNLTIETPLITVEETRYPGRSPRRRRRRENEFRTLDIRLCDLVDRRVYREARDLLRLVPAGLAAPWDTAQLAKALERPRWVAQRLAYCLRECGVVREIARRRNGRLYELVLARPRGSAKLPVSSDRAA